MVSYVKEKKWVFEHRDSNDKSRWELKIANPEARVVVIGSSNMLLAAHLSIPADWEIYAFVGAKLWHVRNVLEMFVAPPKLESIIVAVAVNHRDHSLIIYADTVMAIDGFLKKTGIRYAFIGVSFSSKLSEDQRGNLKLLTNMLRARNNDATYIASLPMAEVVTSDDIHHTMPIVEKILDSVRRHVDASLESARSGGAKSGETTAVEITTYGDSANDDNDGYSVVPSRRRGGQCQPTAQCTPGAKRHLDDDSQSSWDGADKRPCVNSTPNAAECDVTLSGDRPDVASIVENLSIEGRREEVRRARIVDIDVKRSRIA